MTTEISLATRSREENWLPVLELAVEEVFEIMLGCRVRPLPKADRPPAEEFTAMVGLAGAMCGILTVSCDGKTAAEMARCMLGAPAESEDQVADALGKISNMVAGNFKNKLACRDERCLLSVPSVISGGEYNFRSMADGIALETILLFESAPVAVRLRLHS